MLGGIFRFQDQNGFPIDASFDLCKEKGYEIDWLEAICDCWLNDSLKYDSFIRQANMLTNVNLHDKFVEAGSIILAEFPKIKQTLNPVDITCKYILAKKRNRTWDKNNPFKKKGIYV
jgi:hypothetical protein